MAPRWVQRFAGRLDWELADFRRRGLPDFLLDEGEFANGRVVLDGKTAWKGQTIPLRIVYPDLFPYFRPEVFAPGLRLGRHQNPFEGNLCLLEAPTRAWGTNETAAWLVAERVPFLLGLLEQGGDEMLANEVPQGEPDSFYIARAHGTAVFVDEPFLSLPAEVHGGAAYFSFTADRVSPEVFLLLRQTNAFSKSGGGKPIAHASERLREQFRGEGIEGRWVRLKRVPGRDPDSYFAAAAQVQESLANPSWQRAETGEIAILGAVFSEEVQRGLTGDSWIFVVRWRNQGRSGVYLTKGERSAPEDLFARIPRLTGLASKSVALTGLGSLGAPLALELGRAQVGDLRILDHDIVEMGTIVRWPVGLPAVGTAKTAVIEATIKSHFPYTSCQSFDRHLGVASSEPHGEEDDFELIERMIDGADVVVDATAELAVQQLLGDLAGEASIPQVFLWGTEGAFGGVVARVVPGQTGCWFCLQLGFEDESIPTPPLEATGTTQPRGCGTRTFTGENFNLMPIVAQAALTTVGTLLGTRPIGQDVLVMSLRDDDEPGCAPMWSSYPLRPHPKCPHCSAP
jgi:molybdopterin/thiamine biosynthesis adenylyltransferase